MSPLGWPAAPRGSSCASSCRWGRRPHRCRSRPSTSRCRHRLRSPGSRSSPSARGRSAASRRPSSETRPRSQARLASAIAAKRASASGPRWPRRDPPRRHRRQPPGRDAARDGARHRPGRRDPRRGSERRDDARRRRPRPRAHPATNRCEPPVLRPSDRSARAQPSAPGPRRRAGGGARPLPDRCGAARGHRLRESLVRPPPGRCHRRQRPCPRSPAPGRRWRWMRRRRCASCIHRRPMRRHPSPRATSTTGRSCWSSRSAGSAPC